MNCWKNCIATACLAGLFTINLTCVIHAQTIQGAGATFPEPIYKLWFARFQQSAKISVNYQAVGSGAGITQLQNRTVDFGASDAPLSAEEEKSMPGPVIHIPTVGGAVVLTYNLPGIPNGLHFTPEIIAGIFLGKIKSWGDGAIRSANPGINIPQIPIRTVHRTDGSGTTYIFTHYLKKVNKEWAAKVGAGKSVSWTGGLSGKGNSGVAAVVQRTPGAVGYTELAYAVQQKLTYGAIRNKAGAFIFPSVESTEYAISQYVEQLKIDVKTPTVDAGGINSYPICSMTYIIIYRSSLGNAKLAAKLWSWSMQNAQQDMVKALYYAPVPPALRKINIASLKSIQGSSAK